VPTDQSVFDDARLMLEIKDIAARYDWTPAASQSSRRTHRAMRSFPIWPTSRIWVCGGRRPIPI
jgi:hypothetical protein